MAWEHGSEEQHAGGVEHSVAGRGGSERAANVSSLEDVAGVPTIVRVRESPFRDDHAGACRKR